MSRFPGFVLVVAAVSAVLTPQPVSQAAASGLTVHVDARDPKASDAGPGDPSSPFKSISGALRAAARLGGSATPITILVHPGTYRETVIVQQPVMLQGQAGAEIRGSDPWATTWTRAGNYWTHAGAPTFPPHGVCGGIECRDAVHVFYDGRPLRHVAGPPASGQFEITPDRVLIVADTPEGHLVEVTTRPHWVVIASSGVMVKGFRMKHAANSAQSGALDADGYSNITVADNLLSDTHGAVVSIRNGSNARVIGNEISRGGQLGVHLFRVADSLIQSNHISSNNTYGFEGGWEAGGLKASRASRLTIDGNDVGSNDGAGLWCDGDCSDVTISRNRVHDNNGPGIQYEISHTGRIFNNVVWKNGLSNSLDSNHWGWGAGILVQNSNGCEVFDNTLAWNSNGIAVLEQNRGPAYLVFNTSVRDNTIVAQGPQGNGLVYALAWLSDHSTKMYAASQHNTASLNRFGYSGVGELANWTRFAWDGNYSWLAEFGATSGGTGGSYLTLDQQKSVLSAARIPQSP